MSQARAIGTDCASELIVDHRHGHARCSAVTA
jgi:hypothetical protein